MEHLDKKKIIQELYTDYSDDLYRFILLMTSDSKLAEDLTQETFLRAFQKLHTFQEKSSQKTWLYSISRNVTIDYLRRKKPFVRLSGALKSSLKSTEQSPQKVVEIKELQSQVYKAMKNLPLKYQEVLILRKINQFTVHETTQILGWSEGKVKMTLMRAMKALENELVKGGYVHET